MYLDLRNHAEDTLPELLRNFLTQDFHENQPFSPLLLDYCNELSQKLINSEDADMAALGFWLRPSHIQELKKQFGTLPKQSLLAPRGLVFHVTASNVDTLFAYSWAIALLCGNGNLVRLPSIQSPAIITILEIMQNLLKQKRFLPLERANCFMHYAHQEVITAKISLAANMRVIWGSNATIQTLRSIPLNPYATEIVFPDRFSYGIIDVSEYKKMSREKKQFLAQAFFRDVYGFDQNGCSSPRLIFWVNEGHEIETAVAEFSEYLEKEIEFRGYELPLSSFLNKQTLVYAESAKLPVSRVSMPCNELTTIVLEQFDPLCRSHTGGGLLYHVPLDNLLDLVNIANVSDQTVVYHGFDAELIKNLAVSLNGRGPSRFIPFGEALRFSASWDGHDLLQAFTRTITI